MLNQLSIRAATTSDAAALAQLMDQLGYPTQPGEMEMRLRTILDDSQCRVLVGVSDGQVCGMIATDCYQSPEHNGPGGRIVALVVRENMRGLGIGRRLIGAAEKDFISRNVRRIALNTRFQREKAHQFYEKLGYTKNGFRFVKHLTSASC